MRGLGPYAAAFGLGYALGSILFSRNGGPREALILNPNGWSEYVCPQSPCETLGFLAGPSGTVWTGTGVIGSDPSNCLCGQAVDFTPLPNPSYPFQGYWLEMANLPGRYSHVVSFVNHQGVATIPSAEIAPVSAPLIFVDPDPWFRENVGPGIRHNPALAPVVSSPTGPEVGPRPTQAPKPLPGPGPYGYTSGEPSASDQPGVSGNPRPEPVPRPDPLPSRPPKNVKEKKQKASFAYKVAGTGYGFLTETEDVLDAFHDALEKGCGKGVRSKKGSAKAKPVWEPGGNTFRWKRVWNGKFVEWKRDRGQYRAPSYLEKLDTVWRNFDCVNLEKFWENYIDNQAEDTLFGTASKDNKEASKRLRPGIRFGFETGPAL